MAELKDLVQFALDKQPSKFKDAFGDLLSQRVVDRVEELKTEVAANMFGEAPEDEDDIDDLDDEDLEGLEDEDLDFSDEDLELTDEDEDNLFADFDLDDEDMPEDDDEDLDFGDEEEVD